MLCLIKLWFDCVSFGVYFELYAKMKYKTKSMDVLRACTISERGGIWKRMAEVILLPRLNKQSVLSNLSKGFSRSDAMVSRAVGSAFVLKDTRFKTNKSCLYIL